MDNAQIIRDAVREKAQIITGLNRAVWEYAELGYQETKSAAAIIKALEDDGFTVTKELAGIPTAFKAVWGSRKRPPGHRSSGRIRCPSWPEPEGRRCRAGAG